MPGTGRFDNTGGVLHGGYLCVFADALLGSSLRSVSPVGWGMVTADLSVQFLEAVRGARLLEGTGRVSHHGATLAFTDAEIRDAETGAIVLLAQATGLLRERRNQAGSADAKQEFTPPAVDHLEAGILADPPPWAADLGARLTAQGDGTAELVWPLGDAGFTNRGGTIQGGYLCLVADATMGYALVGGIDGVDVMATTTLSMHFIRPARLGTVLRVRAEVTRRGYRFGFMRCTIVGDDDPGRPIATANATGLIRR